MMLRVIASVLLALSVPAYADLKIKEVTDEFTGDTYLRSGNVKLCQPKSAGMAAQCATLRFVWDEQSPDEVLVEVKVYRVASMLAWQSRVGGEIEVFAALDFTDSSISYPGGRPPVSTDAESSNIFRIPIDVLRSISASADNGKVRITGAGDVTTYDFHRRSGWGKTTPAMRVSEFLEAIE